MLGMYNIMLSGANEGVDLQDALRVLPFKLYLFQERRQAEAYHKYVKFLCSSFKRKIDQVRRET
jgi:hypothetical protein